MNRRYAGLACFALLSSPPAWAQLPVGSEFHVNTYTYSYQFFPHVAADATSRFIVVWTSLWQDGSNGGIFGQRYDASGAKDGPEFQINTYTPADQIAGRVAANPNGGFVVSWVSGQDGSARGIFARRFDMSGNGGVEFRVNTYTTGRQTLPTLATDAAGNFVIAWHGEGQGDTFGIFAQRYDVLGTAQGSEFRVNTYTVGRQQNPAVAMDPSGNFVVVWNSNGDGTTGYQIRGQRFDAAGSPLGAEMAVTTPVGATQSQYPSVAVAADGRFVVAWHSYNYFAFNVNYSGVRARAYRADGTPEGAPFQVNAYTTGHQSYPSIAASTNGSFVVAWSSYPGQDGSYGGVFGRVVVDGGVVGSEFQLNTYTVGWQDTVALAAGGNGDFVAVWNSWDDQDGEDGAGVFGHRFESDLIFRSGFNRGDLSGWSLSSSDGGDLSVTAEAALGSTSFGLQGFLDDVVGLWVQDNSPNDERRYRARFLLDPNGFDPGEAALQRRTRTFIAYTEAPSRRVAAVVLRRLNGAYAVMGRARQDSGEQADTGFFTISDAPHTIEIDLVPATDPDALDGRFELWIDGVSQGALTGLDNSAAMVDFARLGALSVKSAANGTLYWDEFESRRGTYIGLLP